MRQVPQEFQDDKENTMTKIDRGHVRRSAGSPARFALSHVLTRRRPALNTTRAHAANLVTLTTPVSPVRVHRSGT